MRTFIVALAALLLTLPGTGWAETLYFIHVDHLGTPRLAIGEDGVERWRWDNLEPFGDNVPIETMGTEGYLINLPLRFPGQYADKETGLAYNMARDYASDTGRYVQSDPIGLRGGVNTYAYVSGAPLTGTDPSGLQGVATIPEAGLVITIGCLLTPGCKEAMENVAKQIADACKTKSCPPCTPHAAGTIGYIGPHDDHDHYPVGRPHLNLYVVNQDPTSCKCHWNKNTPDYAKPPPQPDWVDLNGGFPVLSP